MPAALLLLIFLAAALPEAVADPIGDLTRYLDDHPADFERRLQRGELYRLAGHHALAAADFEAVRSARADHPMIDWHEGRLALDLESFELANRLLSRHLERRPDDSVAWYWRGVARYRLAQFPAAADDFRQAMELTEYPSPLIDLARLLSLIAAGPDHVAASTVAARESLERHPGHPALIGLAVDLALSLQDARRVVSLLLRVPSRHAGDWIWNLRRGLWTCIDGQLEDAGRQLSGLPDPPPVLSGQTYAPRVDKAEIEKLAAAPGPAACAAMARNMLDSRQF